MESGKICAIIAGIGVLLITNPVWASMLAPIGLGGGYQWFTMLGWVYVVAGSSAWLLFRIFERPSTTLVIVSSMLTAPVLFLIFLSGILQPNPPSSLEYTLESTFLLFPTALGIPLGYAHARTQYPKVAILGGVFLGSLLFEAYLTISEFGSMAILFLLLNWGGVFLFTGPMYVAGRKLAYRMTRLNKEALEILDN